MVFLIAITVTIANVHDSKAAYLLMRVLKEDIENDLKNDATYKFGSLRYFFSESSVSAFFNDGEKQKRGRDFCFLLKRAFEFTISLTAGNVNWRNETVSLIQSKTG